jgi:amidase
MDAPVDPEVARAVEQVARTLSEMGHVVEAADFPFDAARAAEEMTCHWFFGFHLWLNGFAAKLGRAVGPETLEPGTLAIYEFARDMDPYRFLAAHAFLNDARREIGRFFTGYDVLLSPTTAQVSQPHGLYGLDLPGMSAIEVMLHEEKPVQYCFPYNVAGAPALSLPLAMHSNGLPIGIELGARPAEEHLLISLGAALDEALPWRDRTPPLHVKALAGAQHRVH